MKIRFYPIFMLLSIGLLVPLVLSSCSKSNDKTAADADVDYYTCTMHPSVHSKDPGKCPICSMDLVPVKKKGPNATKVKENSGGMTDSGSSSMGSMAMPSPHQEAGKSSEFSVPVERQQQIGVTYATATKRPIELSIRSVGMLEPDTSKMFDYVARVDGYVQELKVSSPGQDVSQGQPLITIYSPDLRSTEQELVNILNDRDRGGTSRVSNDQMIDASKRRLKLWNVSDQEIAELEKSRKPSDQLVLRSPFDGVVNEVMSRPGMNVKMGDKLVSVLDLSNLWVWAEFYEARFEVPRVGDADTFAYYFEAKYKFTPQLFGALRWNQQLFDSVDAAGEGKLRWGQDLGRLDISAGYRFTPHTQLKLQYSFQLQTDGPGQTNHLLAAQFTVRF